MSLHLISRADATVYVRLLFSYVYTLYVQYLAPKNRDILYVHHCIYSKSDRLGLNAKIQINFRTVDRFNGTSLLTFSPNKILNKNLIDIVAWYPVSLFSYITILLFLFTVTNNRNHQSSVDQKQAGFSAVFDIQWKLKNLVTLCLSFRFNLPDNLQSLIEVNVILPLYIYR